MTMHSPGSNMQLRKSPLKRDSMDGNTPSPSKIPRETGTSSRARGTSPRARGTSPRARGTSPKATSTSPKATSTSPRARGTSPRTRVSFNTTPEVKIISHEEQSPSDSSNAVPKLAKNRTPTTARGTGASSQRKSAGSNTKQSYPEETAHGLDNIMPNLTTNKSRKQTPEEIRASGAKETIKLAEIPSDSEDMSSPAAKRKKFADSDSDFVSDNVQRQSPRFKMETRRNLANQESYMVDSDNITERERTIPQRALDGEAAVRGINMLASIIHNSNDPIQQELARRLNELAEEYEVKSQREAFITDSGQKLAMLDASTDPEEESKQMQSLERRRSSRRFAERKTYSLDRKTDTRRKVRDLAKRQKSGEPKTPEKFTADC